MINEISTTFKNRLLIALKTKNIKQIELAKATGISKSTISSYLSGRYIPKEDAINKISNVLGCTPSWLFGYEPIINNTEEYPDEYFSICIKDDTMHPNIIKNDTVVIRKQEHFTDGDLIAILINNNTIIRKIYSNDKMIVLLPFNLKYKPELLSSKDKNFKIIGLVKQVIREI